ncbi:MAG TPA: hypothetical protein VK897_27405 [Anaerolineales bacterium]|nr:hypothetical protein [Anaerolineales bacterium]
MEFINDFLPWAWARHHNVLSWYIRPLFIIPFIYFAYKRSWGGMTLTVIALATSMFWFPAPAVADPMVEQFLAAELEYLTGTWTVQKILMSLVVPAFFILLGLAFWKRSWWWGVAVINLAALGKVAWSVAEGGQSGWAVLIPALIGLIICNLAVYFGVKYVHGKRMQNVTSF